MYQQGMKCPCGSGLQINECCGVIIAGERSAVTAEQLMRSRYSAHVLGDVAYLGKTWHPSTRPTGLVLEEQISWVGLEVIASIAGREDDDEGEVEFRAHYSVVGQDGSLHELSRFVKEGGQWLYLDGDIREENETLITGRHKGHATLNKVGRNEPCPCGSGRKYKRCCGAA